MRWALRFSIRSMFLAIAAIAICLVSLRYANSFWETALNFLLAVFLCSTIPGVIYCVGAKRATWVGAAVFGWLSLVMMNAPWFERYMDYPLNAVGTFGHRQLLRTYTPPVPDGGYVQLQMRDDGQKLLIRDRENRWPERRIALNTTLPDYNVFLNVVHSIGILLMALIGSVISRVAYSSGRRQRLQQAPATPSRSAPY